MRTLTRDATNRFTTAFNVLAVSKHASHEDVKIEAALLVLGDLPIESVEYAAQRLARESNSFMPDYGSWYEVADTHAANSLVAETEVAQLTSGRYLQEEEQVATKAARDAFMEAYETLAGKRLPSDHVWRSEAIQLPHFSCPDCTDSGWRQHDCRTEDQCASCRLTGRHIYDHSYVDRCDCFASNPSLQAARSRSHYTTTLSKNKRRP
jgi:hypothetical protein